MPILLRKLLPYLLTLAAVGAILWWAYERGYGRCELQAKADTVEAVKRALEQQAALQAENDAISQAWAEQEAKARIHTRIITRKVIEYVQAHPDNPQCFDPDGVLLVNQIGAGRTAEDRSEPAAAVPGDAAGAP